MNKLMLRSYIVGVATIAGVLSMAGVAGASTTDPVTEATNFVTSGGEEIFPMIIAVATALLGLLVLTIGIRMAWSGIKSRGKKSPV